MGLCLLWSIIQTHGQRCVRLYNNCNFSLVIILLWYMQRFSAMFLVFYIPKISLVICYLAVVLLWLVDPLSVMFSAMVNCILAILCTGCLGFLFLIYIWTVFCAHFFILLLDFKYYGRKW